MVPVRSRPLAVALLGLVCVGCGGSGATDDGVIVDPRPKAVGTADVATASNAAPAPAPAAPAPAAAPAAAPSAPAAMVEIDESQFGAIKGRLVFKGDPPAPALLVKMGDASVKDAAVCSTVDHFDRSVAVDPDTKGLAGCFVYLNRPNGDNAGLRQNVLNTTAVLDQVHCEYLPYTVFVMTGQKFLLKSSDPVNHNVRYTPFSNRPFNQILPGNGSTEVSFNSPERSPIETKCDIHPWMSGWFLVVDHPFFSTSGTDGSFEIKGVPPGTQSLLIRLPKGGYLNQGKARGQEITVSAGEVTDLGEIEIQASDL